MPELKPSKIEINSMRTTIDPEGDPVAIDFVLTVSHPTLTKVISETIIIEEERPLLDEEGKPVLDSDNEPVKEKVQVEKVIEQTVPITRTVYCRTTAGLSKAKILMRLKNRVIVEWQTWLKEIERDAIKVVPIPTNTVKPNTTEELIAFLGIQEIIL